MPTPPPSAPTQATEPAPSRAALDQEAAQHRRRMGIFLVAGLCMPELFGVLAAAGAALFDLGWVGMDSYVPLFLGGAAGCCVGAGFLVAAVVEHRRAAQCRRLADALAG